MLIMAVQSVFNCRLQTFSFSNQHAYVNHGCSVYSAKSASYY